MDKAREFYKRLKAEINLALDSNYRALKEFEYSEELYKSVSGKISALRGISDFADELFLELEGIN